MLGGASRDTSHNLGLARDEITEPGFNLTRVFFQRL